MFCNKCGNEIKNNQLYCNKCGNRININTQTNTTRTKNKKEINLFVPTVIVGIIIILVLLISSYILFSSNKNKYSFGDEIAIEQNKPSIADQPTTDQPTTTTKKKGKYKTDIITDNVYSGLSIKSLSDAKKVIVEDSVNQKQEDYPQEIIEIENRIIEKYGITAVNLKELDVEFAKEIETVIDNIWNEYPKAREYLTNLTLTNLSMADKNVIAQFMSVFVFGTSNTNTTRPWVIKTQVQLNSRFFLNPDKLETSAKTGSQSGFNPKNATRYSTVAHELGHYLSFIALLNHHSTKSILVIEDSQMQNYYNIVTDFGKNTFSKQMLEEAYENYIKETNDNVDFDEWRGQISGYALAKDGSGEYIYDETIAEAFHDVYLNKDDAAEPSKYIVEVLKKYVGK